GTTTAIGHTRWATHGAPTTTNAHPHVGEFGPHLLAVVHNGIIENHATLREHLSAAGARFVSATDTETLPFALAYACQQGVASVTAALQQLLPTLHGNFAVVAMAQGAPEELWGTRRGAPLCVGLGEGANYLVSDPLALAGVCHRFIFLEDNDVVHLTPHAVTIFAAGQPVQRPVQTLDLSAEAGGKQGYKHFMLKEIHEQPAVLARILQAHTDPASLLPTLPLPAAVLQASAINLVACGTAYYAGMVGKYYLEQLARIPVNVDVASEFRYRNPPYSPGGLFIAVSQSGETADTLAALEHAKAAGQTILVFTNVPTSSMARAAHAVVPLLAGREIAVASTKAFSAMVTNLLLFALQLALQRQLLPAAEASRAVQALRELPTHLQEQLEHPHAVQQLAATLANLPGRSLLYLGRGLLAPLAYEGALKLKEISYLHAESYPSGEMKHGPIALVEPGLPVINLAASNDGLFEKTLSNLQEVAARRGDVVLITDTVGAQHLPANLPLQLITVPTVHPLLLPLVFSIPLQQLAYFTATAKGTDVDQPRNLAKSVTVE
ncbi:MAG: glutamine--fructose-6-phosphate transaminase (isomerizing), partial [Alphaproteobacteria bacterium]|nr:glutamine--fructose-6-phosphate transaminase (isomerizing) [Alphaproteobacteria bacterium]